MKKSYWRQTALLLTGAFLWNLPVGACADLSLQQAINLALQQNMSIKITQKSEETAEAALRQAKGAKGFAVTASGGYTATKTDDEQMKNSLTGSVTAKLPLYTGGKTENTIQSSEIGLKAASLTTERQREDIRFSVIKAYYDALEARKTIDVDQEAVNKYQAHLTNVEQLYSAGSKAHIDVLRSSVELSDARQTLIKDQNAYEVDLAILRDYLNIDRNEPLNLTDDVVYEPFDKDMNACVDYAYQNRKDLLVDTYTMEQKELAVKIAEAGMRPTVSLSVGSSLGNQFTSYNDKDETRSFTAGVSASWNIFDNGITRAQIDSAKTERDIARLQLDKARDDVDLTVRQDYYNMREAEKRFNSTQDAVKQAQEDYYVSREKYRAGEGLLLDVIDTQQALSKAELNYISAQYDYARYKAAVENAMGVELTDEEKQAAGVLPTVKEATATQPTTDTAAQQQATKAATAPAATTTTAPTTASAATAQNVQPAPAQESPETVAIQTESVADEAAANGGDA